MATNEDSVGSPQPSTDPAQDNNNRVIFTTFSKHVGQLVTIATGVGADTEFAVAHSLGFKPNQVELLITEGQGINYIQIRPSATPWTKSNIYLQCNTATVTVKLRIS